MADVDYSYIRRDLDDVEADFQQQMPVVSEGKWKSFDQRDPGYTLFRALLWFNDKGSFLLDRTMTESFLSTAKTPEGVRRGAANLGYPIGQIQPATCQVKLTFPAFNSNIIIPVGSNWSISNTTFTCLNTIQILAGQTTVNTTLVQGTSYTPAPYIAPGSGFYKISVPPNTANLQVLVGGVLWTAIDSFISPPVPTAYKLFEESDGSKTIEFGSNINTYAPASGVSIQVTGVITLGSAGNIGQSGLTCRPLSQLSDDVGNTITNNVTGVTLTSALDGTDEESLDSIRTLAPRYYAEGNPARLVNESDYETDVLRIPGVTDVQVEGGEKVGAYSEVIITVYGPSPYVVSPDFLQSIQTALAGKNVASITPIVQAPDIIEIKLGVLLGLADTSVQATTDATSAAQTAIQNKVTSIGIGGVKNNAGGGLFTGQLDAVIVTPAITNIVYAVYTFQLISFATSSAGKLIIPVVSVADYTHAVLTDASNNVLLSGDLTANIANDQFIYSQAGMADQVCTLTYKDLNGQIKLKNKEVVQLTALTITTEAASDD